MWLVFDFSMTDRHCSVSVMSAPAFNNASLIIRRRRAACSCLLPDMRIGLTGLLLTTTDCAYLLLLQYLALLFTCHEQPP